MICFMGANQAGIVGLLTILSLKEEVLSAVSYSDELTEILDCFNIPTYQSIHNPKFIEDLKKAELLISVHGREIVPKELLGLPSMGCINVHPYLYKYKGLRPVKRALEDKNFKASVGVHIMSEKVDEGQVIVEEFVDVGEAKSEEEIHNRLYPYYVLALLKVLNM